MKNLFNGEDFELELLEIPLNKFEDNDTNEKLLNEINYLKNLFEYDKINEKQMVENLILYKNRKNISLALKSLNNLYQKISFENIIEFNLKIEKITECLINLKKYSETRKIIEEIKNIDNNFFEKNFIEILLNFYEKDELIKFLSPKKESETRNLIDGLFDEDVEENFNIELKDIEILINVVCFFQDIKSKANDLNIFIRNFHSILENKKDIYKEIVSNIVHIKNNLELLQEYIKNQLRKKYRFSTDLEKFLTKGIIRFDKLLKSSILAHQDEYISIHK